MSKKQRIFIEERIKFIEVMVQIAKDPEDVEFFTIQLFEEQRKIISNQG